MKQLNSMHDYFVCVRCRWLPNENYSPTFSLHTLPPLRQYHSPSLIHIDSHQNQQQSEIVCSLKANTNRREIIPNECNDDQINSTNRYLCQQPRMGASTSLSSDGAGKWKISVLLFSSSFTCSLSVRSPARSLSDDDEQHMFFA